MYVSSHGRWACACGLGKHLPKECTSVYADSLAINCVYLITSEPACKRCTWGISGHGLSTCITLTVILTNRITRVIENDDERKQGEGEPQGPKGGGWLGINLGLTAATPTPQLKIICEIVLISVIFFSGNWYTYTLTCTYVEMHHDHTCMYMYSNKNSFYSGTARMCAQ